MTNLRVLALDHNPLQSVDQVRKRLCKSVLLAFAAFVRAGGCSVSCPWCGASVQCVSVSALQPQGCSAVAAYCRGMAL